jgi:hypothetical protein
METVKERMNEWQLGVETEEVRTRTIMDRVRDRLPDLLHESLYRRKKAAFFLGIFLGISRYFFDILTSSTRISHSLPPYKTYGDNNC